jgi:uncharacterized membrane protein HdeD (DUF308 family)
MAYSGVELDDAQSIAAAWRDEVALHWKRFLVVGIACNIAGLSSILVPLVASISVAILAGWVLVIGGAVQLAHGVRTRMWWRVVGAVLAIVAGLLILLFPLSGTISLTVVLVAWFWMTGFARLTAWWSTRHAEGSWMLGLNGALSVILGAFVWLDLPSSAAWAIGLLLGIDLVFTGSALIMTALAARQLRHQVRVGTT